MARIPFQKDIDFRVGEPDQLAPSIRRVIAGNAGPFTYTGSGTYLVGQSSYGVIDPGPNDPAHIDAIIRAADSKPITHIFVTHTHLDHCGGAAALAFATGAKILAFGAHGVTDKTADAPALEEGADYGFTPDIHLRDGDEIAGTDWKIEAVHTPGHLSNHMCYSLRSENALFTGDHVMGWATTVVAPPDGHMGAYIDSLDKLLKRDERVYFPTHGAPIGEPHKFVRAVRAHRLFRDKQILTHLKDGPHTIKQLVDKMYTDVDKKLHGAAALNIFAHLITLGERGETASAGPPKMDSTFTIHPR